MEKKDFREDKLLAGAQIWKNQELLLWFSAVQNLISFVDPVLPEFFLRKFKIILFVTLLERLRGLFEARMRGLLLASLVVLSVRQDVVETAHSFI
jgi:hypothetical protein